MITDRAVAATFGALSRLRGTRIFHPKGVGFETTLTPLGAGSGTRLFDGAEGVDAIVRISRSLGLPEALPDPFGIAIRVPGAYGDGRHQDFLLVSSGRRPVARHLLLPARDASAPLYSSLLPYRFGGTIVIVGAVAETRAAERLDLHALRSIDPSRLSFRICMARPTGGWIDIAKLELDRRLPDELTERIGFNPANDGGGIELAGAINRLRIPAYAGSQKGRGSPEPVRAAASAPEALSPRESAI